MKKNTMQKTRKRTTCAHTLKLALFLLLLTKREQKHCLQEGWLRLKVSAEQTRHCTAKKKTPLDCTPFQQTAIAVLTEAHSSRHHSKVPFTDLYHGQNWQPLIMHIIYSALSEMAAIVAKARFVPRAYSLMMMIRK